MTALSKAQEMWFLIELWMFPRQMELFFTLCQRERFPNKVVNIHTLLCKVYVHI